MTSFYFFFDYLLLNVVVDLLCDAWFALLGFWIDLICLFAWFCIWCCCVVASILLFVVYVVVCWIVRCVVCWVCLLIVLRFGFARLIAV